MNTANVNREVINNVKNVVLIGAGVCYTTDKGLFVVNGMDVIELSEVIENEGNQFPVTDLAEITELITNIKYVDSLLDSLSTVGFLEYLESNKIGCVHINKEVVVTSNS